MQVRLFFRRKKTIRKNPVFSVHRQQHSDQGYTRSPPQTERGSWTPLDTASTTGFPPPQRPQRRGKPKPPPVCHNIDIDPENTSTEDYMSQLHVNEHDEIRINFNGIICELTRFQLVDSGSEDFKAICSAYPLFIQGHLKEMRRKFKNRVSIFLCKKLGFLF